MQLRPTQIKLEIKPKSRYDLINVSEQITRNYGDVLGGYPKALYCSLHTTAGFLEERVIEALRHRPEHVRPFIGAFQELFPPNANYSHDQLQFRTELTEEERLNEPRNADSHLVFISSGMKNCVTYENRPDKPVYFIDLDGVNGSECRCRRATVLGYNQEKVVRRVRMAIPVSKHPIDSINLKDSRNGFLSELDELVQKLEITHGKIDVQLADNEEHAGLTVNEYETLLMKHDLAEVLHNPIKYMAIRGKHALSAPQLIPGKTLNYAKYDLVHLFNVLMDKMGVSETVLERILSVFIRLPASHFLSMKRHISLMVSTQEQTDRGGIVFGKYQSPILVQWDKARGETRFVDVTISRFA